ncbi:hypothetical protein Tco_0242695, partial [Tanacetum coccineum]
VNMNDPNITMEEYIRLEEEKARRHGKGEASKDLKAPTEWLRGLEIHFERREDGEIYFFDRIWIPSVGGVRKLIMDEAHTSRYSIHPGQTKMYPRSERFELVGLCHKKYIA